MKRALLAALFVLPVVVLAWVASATPAPAAAEGVGALDGKAVYRRAGCGGCHGELAAGTKIAPALPGHTPKAIRRQVRAATGNMPSYGRDRLTDAELTAIVEWIGTLPVPKQHLEPISMPQLVESHYRMAYVSLKFRDRKDALHHVGHVVASVKGKQLRAAREVRTIIRARPLHEAEHALEDVLSARAKKPASVEKLHLQIAHGAAQAGELRQVRHHVTHFLEIAKGKRRTAGKAILAAIDRKDDHDVLDGVRALLGLGHA